MKESHRFIRIVVLAAIGGGMSLTGETKVVVKTQGFLPFADAPIHYRTSKTLNDQITRLNGQLERGDVHLTWNERTGYLSSVLKELGVPVSSQLLVFSKTSLQMLHISPTSPRALYFNDNVYVGQVKNSKSLELIAFDATQGAVFYVLSEEKVDKPRFERAQLDCVQCHIASTTRRIPGVIVRSVLTTPAGLPKGGSPVHTMGHETPIADRWGGWYVTGAATAPPNLGANVPVLNDAIDVSRLATDTSDVVAHMVLAHQTQMHNFVTELNYRYRLGVYADQKAGRPIPSEETRLSIENSAEATLRYLLFANEAPLSSSLQGDSTFSSDFAALGPRDHKGRSLRDFDLQKRIFKYPCSYLIYSDAFDAIPGPAREYLLKRLFEVLSGQDQSPDFAGLSAEARQAILEILVETKPGLPGEWKEFLSRKASLHVHMPAKASGSGGTPNNQKGT